MASYFFSILCCLGKRSKDQSLLDERSRLIPTTEGESVADNLVGRSAAFDRAVFKDKLGSIVRSKEGHMVNVSSPLPFNLHNKPRAFIDIMTRGSHFSSSSRSASTSTFRESQSPNQPHLNSRPPALVHMRSGLRAPPLNSAGQSRSRSASQSSMTSATSSQRDEERGEKEPSGILGVRLVRGFGPGSRFSSQRGRAKGKQIEEAGMGPANISGHIEPVNDPQDPHAECVDLPQNAPNDGYPEVSISPASDTLEFRLHEVGTLSASWEIER
ncbi:Serine/threonine-protein kinase Chk1 [Termitomyces sp. T112]|nr:Serine/threonine-protein kinase Chk1 [Termitomyces sp. T112]